MATLFLDCETFSEVDIRRAGTYRYAESAEVMLVTWAFDDGDVQVADLTTGEAAAKERVQQAIDQAEAIVIHNAMFDRAVFKFGSPGFDLPLHKVRCCMVRALEHGLPGSLDKLCQILHVADDAAKIKDGKRLIQLFCKPRPKNIKLRRATAATHPADWQKFVEYAKADITAMRAVWRRLPGWNYGGNTEAARKELALWHLDQEMNDLGIPVDMDLVDGCLAAIAGEKKRLNAAVTEQTDGYVTTLLQRDRMLEFMFGQYGIAPDDLRGTTVEKFLAHEDLPAELRSLLEIRLEANRSSASKYTAFRDATSKDGRVRGMLQFSGASRTRRDAGRKVQLQNLPSRGLLKKAGILLARDAFKAGVADLVFDDVMHAAMSTVRSVLVAPPGCKICVSDLSNIEGRMLAWMAGEDWKLKAFRDFDAGSGHDLYKLAYAKSFGIKPEDATKAQRDVGKVQELALGYEGGVSAFVTFANGYRIDLEELADQAWDVLDADLRLESEEFIRWQAEQGRRYPMSERAAVVCNAFKMAWRKAHPNTVQLWKAFDRKEDGQRRGLFADAVQNPGEMFSYRGFASRKDGEWLRIRLPSGRYLSYPLPEVTKDGLSFMGVNQFTRKWERIQTYSGKLVENATQSLARDCLFDRLLAAKAAGYAPVLRVHDEVISITPDTGEFTAEGLSAILATNSGWNEGLPLAAKGEEMYAYGK